MKKYFFIATVILLTMFACKKGPIEFSQKATENDPEKSPEVNAKTICYGNNWTTLDGSNVYGYSHILTYNNKAYIFNRNSPLGESTKIYDGSTFQEIFAAIPFYTYVPYISACFTIGSKGYFLQGSQQLLWEYDFLNNTWTQKGNFPGSHRRYPAFFVINGKGYLVGGVSSHQSPAINYNDTWEYNPVTNVWTQKASFPWIGRSKASGFSIGDKGYIVNGEVEFSTFYVYLNSLLQYNPSTNSWSSKALFPGEPRRNSKAFTIGNFGYAGAGDSKTSGSPITYFRDFYRYNPATDAWSLSIPDVSETDRYLENSFSINSRGYLLDMNANTNNLNLLHKYTPLTCAP